MSRAQLTTWSRLFRGNIIWVLGVFWVSPTKANSIAFSESLRGIGVLVADVLGLFEDIPIVLFSILVSDKF